jgi:large subunit ribosomal protein L30
LSYLFQGPSDFVIVKNSENNNEMLRRVKHLIKIVPITFPNGLPQDESDYPHTLLKETGEFVVKPRVEGQIVSEKPEWSLKIETKKKHWQRILDEKRFIAEYHPAKYQYRFNQDGNEYRYNDTKSK